MRVFRLLALAVMAQLIIGFAVGGVSYKYGFHKAQDKCQHDEIKQLNDSIAATEHLVENADAASLKLNQSISNRIQYDQKTSQDIRNALNNTARFRVACVFDNDIMQQLQQAANHADAAATSGVVSSVPASDTPGK